MRMRQLQVPKWFDPTLIPVLRKKFDRSDMKKYERTLDWFMRQNLKVLPTIMTGVITEKFSWQEIEGIIAENCGRMTASGYRPDVIIGIKSGGAFIAKYVAMCSGMDPEETMGYMKINHYSANSRSIVESSIKYMGKEAKIEEYPSIAFEGMNVLVVDDQTGTGATLKAAIKFFKRNGAASVKTFCLYTRKGIHVDFCVRSGIMVYTPWGKDA